MKVVSFLLRRCQKMSMVQKLCLAQMALPIELIIKCSKFLNIKRSTNCAPHNGVLLSTLLYRYTMKRTSWKRRNPNLLGWCITHCMFLIWRFWYEASGLLRKNTAFAHQKTCLYHEYLWKLRRPERCAKVAKWLRWVFDDNPDICAPVRWYIISETNLSKQRILIGCTACVLYQIKGGAVPWVLFLEYLNSLGCRYRWH